MSFDLQRCKRGCAMVWGLSLLALATTAQAKPTLKDAIDNAWRKHPMAQAQAARQAQYNAQRDAASTWLAEPPSVSLMQRSDRWNRNAGAREIEAELELPLALPGVRDARIALAQEESTQYDANTLVERWRVAGEVREAWWSALLANNELATAQRKADEARQLAADIERRFKAGDVARTDWNQAEGAARLAELGAAEAEGRAFRANQVFRSLTGLNILPEEPEQAAPRPAILDAHVQLAALNHDIGTARARLHEAGANRRDPPSLSVGTKRERSGLGEPSEGSVSFKVTIPFATSARNQPKLTAANADYIQAQARLQQESTRIAGEIAASEAELKQAQRQVELAQARVGLARDTHALFDKAFKLGEIDLATRLRIEADRFNAELSLSRARLEQGRAISRFNQATGQLP